MRNDDHDEIDLSQHRASRLPGILVVAAALGVGLIAAWVFTPILLSRDSAVTAGLFSKPKPAPAAQDQPAAPTLTSAESTPAAPTAPKPDTTATAAATDDQTATGTIGPAVASAAASSPWPQDRGIQVATAPSANPDPGEPAAAAPPDTPTEPLDNVPLPRKRPSRLIEASLVIPLPRPRPEIEPEAPPGPSAFELEVERMR